MQNPCNVQVSEIATQYLSDNWVCLRLQNKDKATEVDATFDQTLLIVLQVHNLEPSQLKLGIFANNYKGNKEFHQYEKVL
jgi:hypothetical protein